VEASVLLAERGEEEGAKARGKGGLSGCRRWVRRRNPRGPRWGGGGGLKKR